MEIMDIQILIVGSAGEGIQTIGDLLGKVMQTQGYSLFTWQEFESRIRGGQNSYRLRISETPKNAPREEADILLGMNPEASKKYLPFLKDNGILVSEFNDDMDNTITIPFSELSREEFGKKIFANTIAIGAVCGMLGVEKSVFSRILEDTFSRKGTSVVETNQQAALKGYDLAKEACGDKCTWRLPKRWADYYVIPGHEAVSLASIYAGCRFIAAYPMSPSTGIITWLSRNEKEFGVFSEQAEDEIAAINMAIGAGFAGARAMTATSGGGFALMAEGISLAGMTETPVVIVLAQRPGPATGLPTRTAQGDLLFAINAGHGEFPRLVMAPANAEDAFHKTVKAFNLAEKYQIPVILLTDQFLADSQFSYEQFAHNKIPPEYYRSDPGAFDNYRRYDVSVENGVSPRLFPGQSAHLVGADSDEHNERGHITEDLSGEAIRMSNKRMDKMGALQREIDLPEQQSVSSADTVLVGWGSTREAILESLDLLNAKDFRVGMMHFTELWPPPDVSFSGDKKYIVVEGNATGQLEQLLRAQYGLVAAGHVRRWDGLPITADYIAEKVLNDGNETV